MSDNAEIRNILEAALLASGRPLKLDELVDLFDESSHTVDRNDVRVTLRAISEGLEGSATELVEVASGHRIQVRAEYAPWIGRLWAERPAKYSRALLETLALIAYRQPVTRGEIEDIRGVSVSASIMKTLQEREWVRVLGHREVPGRPALYGTTRDFLDDFNLRGLEDLPPLAEVRDIDRFHDDMFPEKATAGDGAPDGEGASSNEDTATNGDESTVGVAASGPGQGEQGSAAADGSDDDAETPASSGDAPDRREVADATVDETPDEVTPDEVTPDEVTPGEVTPGEVTSGEVAAEEAATGGTAPEEDSRDEDPRDAAGDDEGSPREPGTGERSPAAASDEAPHVNDDSNAHDIAPGDVADPVASDDDAPAPTEDTPEQQRW